VCIITFTFHNHSFTLISSRTAANGEERHQRWRRRGGKVSEVECARGGRVQEVGKMPREEGKGVDRNGKQVVKE
jgi:hypothetical protein